MMIEQTPRRAGIIKKRESSDRVEELLKSSPVQAYDLHFGDHQ